MIKLVEFDQHSFIIFAVHFLAVGCPLLNLPEYYEILAQDSERALVKCVRTEDSTELTCRGTKWIGNLKNCITTESMGIYLTTGWY